MTIEAMKSTLQSTLAATEDFLGASTYGRHEAVLVKPAEQISTLTTAWLREIDKVEAAILAEASADAPAEDV